MEEIEAKVVKDSACSPSYKNKKWKLKGSNPSLFIWMRGQDVPGNPSSASQDRSMAEDGSLHQKYKIYFFSLGQS